MGKSQLYELSFFIYLIYVLVNKFSTNSNILLGALIAVGIGFLYEVLFLCFFRKEEFLSFGRALAMGLVYLSLVLVIIIAVFVGYAFIVNQADAATLLSLTQLCGFYNLDVVVVVPYGNLIIAAVCFCYIIGYVIVTKKLDNRLRF